MYAPAKPDYPILGPDSIAQFDAFLLGIPTRYGNFPGQWKVRPCCVRLPPRTRQYWRLSTQAFWDGTGKLWASGALAGKSAGVFISTAGLGGGQESTALATMSTLAHHGISFVPLGYSTAFAQLTNLSEVHGGSPWGAGTFAASDGSRQPTPLELEIAQIQGKGFWGHVSKIYKWTVACFWEEKA
jgi:NAD(P)H dehydrogenase (quinone)